MDVSICQMHRAGGGMTNDHENERVQTGMPSYRWKGHCRTANKRRVDEGQRLEPIPTHQKEIDEFRLPRKEQAACQVLTLRAGRARCVTLVDSLPKLALGPSSAALGEDPVSIMMVDQVGPSATAAVSPVEGRRLCKMRALATV
jgi:hypothetical protein